MKNEIDTPAPKPLNAPRSPVPPALALLLTAMCFSACSLRPLHGGRAVTQHRGATTTRTLSQGDNPAQPTTQTEEHLRLRTYTMPLGTSIQSAPRTNDPVHSSHFGLRTSLGPRPSDFRLLVTDLDQSRITTTLGAAQKDTSRETSAKLSSLRALPWVGAALFVFGLASLFWPPLKAIIASTTTSIAIGAGGLALIVLPTLIVGHELLILAAVALTVGAWFLAHRHGHAQGQLAATNPGNQNSKITIQK